MHRICFGLLALALALGLPVHADTSRPAQSYEQVALFPADRSLVRPEDGVMLAELPTPDNIELDASGRLWVASPIANALLVVDPESGGWSTAFHPQTPEHQRLMVEWQRRTESGESRLELIGPDIWAPLPGLFTGLILTHEGGPIYLTGLGDTLVKLEIQD